MRVRRLRHLRVGREARGRRTGCRGEEREKAPCCEEPVRRGALGPGEENGFRRSSGWRVLWLSPVATGDMCDGDPVNAAQWLRVPTGKGLTWFAIASSGLLAVRCETKWQRSENERLDGYISIREE